VVSGSGRSLTPAAYHIVIAEPDEIGILEHAGGEMPIDYFYPGGGIVIALDQDGRRIKK
jgi:hypothetical protein